jgi:hypothetical protein
MVLTETCVSKGKTGAIRSFLFVFYEEIVVKKCIHVFAAVGNTQETGNMVVLLSVEFLRIGCFPVQETWLFQENALQSPLWGRNPVPYLIPA